MKHLMGWILVSLFLVALPSGCATSGLSKGQTVQITLDEDAALWVQDQPTTLEELGDALQVLGASTSTPVLVTVDRRVMHQQVVAILNALKALGFGEVSVVAAK